MNLLSSLLVSSLVMHAAPATDPYGLNPGTKWTYRQTGDGGTDLITKEVVASVEVKGARVAEIKCHLGADDFYEYRGSETGLRSYSNAYLGGHPGVSDSYEPTLLLKPHPEEGSTWTWTRIVPVQTMGRAKIDPEDFRENTVAKVEAVGKAIQTAAGTFSVTLVRYDSQSKLFGKVTVRRWISEKAGIVREERTSAKSKQTLELMDFAPGP